MKKTNKKKQYQSRDLTRSTIRKIAKKYGFSILDFVPLWGNYITYFRRIDYPDFNWIEEDWFETEEICERYFKRWSADWNKTDAEGRLANGVEYEK